jgi:hypothetical protein
MLEKEIAVYTAIFGNYDNLKEPLHPQVNEEADFYCFTNNPDLQSKIYHIIRQEPKFTNPRKSARYFKIKGDPLLQKYKYVIWCDGAIQIIAKSLYEILAVLGEHDFGVFKHPDRICAYEEGKVCMERNLDDVSTIFRQLSGYYKEGFPKNYGLIESSAYIKRVNADTTNFTSMWWHEVNTQSIRDQLSFDYLRWKLKPNISYFSGTFKSSPYFRSKGHEGRKKKSAQIGPFSKISESLKQLIIAQKIRIYQKKLP